MYISDIIQEGEAPLALWGGRRVVFPHGEGKAMIPAFDRKNASPAVHRVQRLGGARNKVRRSLLDLIVA